MPLRQPLPLPQLGLYLACRSRVPTTGVTPFGAAYVCYMDRKSRLRAALFGVKSGVVWVADDAILTRQCDGILVKRWVGGRVVSVLVREDSTGTARAIWERLNELAD